MISYPEKNIELNEFNENDPGEIILHSKEIELQNKIKKMASNNLKIRVHGGNHSNYFDNAFYPGSNVINVSDYKIDPWMDGDILTASAGHSLDYLRKFLKKYGLRMLGTPESKYITLGGAVVVGAHGGSSYQKTMTDYVTEMLLFDSKGNVIRLLNKNLFVNFGVLGVVFRISIKCYPAENIYWQTMLHNNINDIVITPNTHSLVFGPYNDKVLETKIFPTDRPAKKTINRRLWEIVLVLTNTQPITKIVSNVGRSMFYLFPSLGLLVSHYFLYEPSVVRDKYDYFNIAPQTKVYTQEYSVNINYLKDVYSSLKNVIIQYREKGTYVSYRFWVRFVPQSEVLNTLSYDGDSAVFELTYSKDQPNAKEFALLIDQIFRSFGGKPHLGKTLISTESLSNYNFDNLQDEIFRNDPKKLFQNNFIESILANPES